MEQRTPNEDPVQTNWDRFANQADAAKPKQLGTGEFRVGRAGDAHSSVDLPHRRTTPQPEVVIHGAVRASEVMDIRRRASLN